MTAAEPIRRTGVAAAVTELFAPANLAVGQLLVVGDTAVASGTVAALTLTLGPSLALASPAVALVAWARVRLGDHTAAQTVAGAVLGGLVATTVLVALR